MSEVEFREIDGRVYYWTEDEGIEVCKPMVAKEVGCNSSGQWYITLTYFDGDDYEKEVSYFASIFAGSGSEVMKQLLNDGFIIDPDGKKYFIKYLFWLYKKALAARKTNA